MELDSTIMSYLNLRIKEGYNDGLVVCQGHSHPPLGKFHQNFTLGDFTTYLQINEDNEAFYNRSTRFLGCMLTCTGDVDFVTYDIRKQDFYRYTHVYVKDINGNLKPVNAYGLNQSSIIQKTS